MKPASSSTTLILDGSFTRDHITRQIITCKIFISHKTVCGFYSFILMDPGMFLGGERKLEDTVRDMGRTVLTPRLSHQLVPGMRVVDRFHSFTSSFILSHVRGCDESRFNPGRGIRLRLNTLPAHGTFLTHAHTHSHHRSYTEGSTVRTRDSISRSNSGVFLQNYLVYINLLFRSFYYTIRPKVCERLTGKPIRPCRNPIPKSVLLCSYT